MESFQFELVERELGHKIGAGLTSESRRLFHGRGRLFEGFEHLCIDWFDPALVVTLFADLGSEWESALTERLSLYLNDQQSLYIQRRYADTARRHYEHVSGPTLSCLSARRSDLKFALQLNNQNIGYFLDIEPARCWLERHVKGMRVLNLFSYTCSFSVLATASGAKSVLNMDLSSTSLSVGRESYKLNGLALDGVRFFANDILKSWSRLKRFGPYDIVIVDPPSFQKGSFVASKDYHKVTKRMAQLTSDSARVLLCLNAPEVKSEAFKFQLEESLSGFQFEEKLDLSEDFENADPDRGLKMFVYKKC